MLLSSAERPGLVAVVSGDENLTRAVVTEPRHETARARLLAVIRAWLCHVNLSVRRQFGDGRLTEMVLTLYRVDLPSDYLARVGARAASTSDNPA